VPKTFQLQMMPASSTVINSGIPVTQVMRILNPTRVRSFILLIDKFLSKTHTFIVYFRRY
jgi:hypothetical protein